MDFLGENLRRGTVSLTIEFFKSHLLLTLKHLLTTHFTGKAACSEPYVSKPSFMQSLFKSLLSETQTTNNLDLPSAMNTFD